MFLLEKQLLTYMLRTDVESRYVHKWEKVL